MYKTEDNAKSARIKSNLANLVSYLRFSPTQQHVQCCAWGGGGGYRVLLTHPKIATLEKRTSYQFLEQATYQTQRFKNVYNT
jgi:hypothetical protein